MEENKISHFWRERIRNLFLLSYFRLVKIVMLITVFCNSVIQYFVLCNSVLYTLFLGKKETCN